MDISKVSNIISTYTTASICNENNAKVSTNIINNTSNQDSVIINSYDETALPCDNYTASAISLKKLSYSFGVDMRQNIMDTLYDYYSGNVTEQDVLDCYENWCQKYYEFKLQNGIISDSDEDKQAVILQTYETFQHLNSLCAVNTGRKEADKIAEECGYTGEGNRDFVYYDSNLYYKCESVRSSLIEKTDNIFQTSGLDDTHLKDKIATVEESTEYPGITFNEVWNDYAKNGINLCEMADTSIQPPENFSFFYKQNYYSSILDSEGNITLDSQKGIAIITQNNILDKLFIPFNNSTALGELKEYFNVGNLYENMDLNSESMSFIQYFSVYTRTYSFFHLSK